MWFLSGEFFNLCSSYVDCSAYPVCFILLRITLFFFSSLWAGSWKNLFDAKKKKEKKKLHMGALGSQRLFNMYNKWHWLGLFTFGGNIPYSSLCIVFFFMHWVFTCRAYSFFSLHLSPVTFFSLGSFSTSCIFLWWDVYPEETEQNFSYNFSLLWSLFWNRSEG